MRAYLAGLLLSCAVAAVAAALAAEGTTKKYVRFLLSVVLLLVLLSPLRGMEDWKFSVCDTAQPGGEGGEKEHQAILLTAAENALRDALCSEFALQLGDVLISLDGGVGESGDVALTAVTVTLSGDAGAARERVRAYLTREMRSQCEIYVYIGETRD